MTTQVKGPQSLGLWPSFDFPAAGLETLEAECRPDRRDHQTELLAVIALDDDRILRLSGRQTFDCVPATVEQNRLPECVLRETVQSRPTVPLFHPRRLDLQSCGDHREYDLH